MRKPFSYHYTKALLALAVWGLYICFFLLSLGRFGPQITALVLLPTILTAQFWGLQAGFLAGLFGFAVNTAAFNLVGSESGSWAFALRQGGAVGHIAALLVGVTIGYLRDIRHLLYRQKEQLIKQQKQLLHLAQHDVLTNLPNRALFMDRLEQALTQVKRNGGVVAVCFLDLNGFKEVNDTWGHAAGDTLLKQIAERLAGRCRRSDTLARMGGDEFTVIATGLKDAQSVKQVANTLLEAFHLPFVVEGQAVRISSSLGVALYPQDGRNADELLQVADSAMYAVKRSQNGVERDMTKYLTSH